MNKKLKQKVERVKQHVIRHGELYLLAGGAVIVGLAGKKLSKPKKVNVPEVVYPEQGGLKKKDKLETYFLYQLDDQDQCWGLIASQNGNGDEPDYKEIGRQIANGEYRED